MWFKKYWLAILGVALQTQSLWNLIIWSLDWRGRFDALAATYHDIGGYGVMIEFFLTPPPWFYPLAFGTGLILIWWNVSARSVDIKREEIKSKLKQFYIEVGPIITRYLPRYISDSDFNGYIKEAEAWATNTVNWIDANMGMSARERFLDRTGMLTLSYRNAINATHNSIINNLTRMRQNLLALIESGAWDT